MTSQSTREQFVFFALTGVFGFFVDVGVLYLLMWLGLTFVLGRLGSFLCAVAATWVINRRNTFRATRQPSAGEFLRYLAAMSLGGSINYLSSYITVQAFPKQRLIGVLAVAVGSLLGLAVNFAASKFWVFRQDH